MHCIRTKQGNIEIGSAVVRDSKRTSQHGHRGCHRAHLMAREYSCQKLDTMHKKCREAVVLQQPHASFISSSSHSSSKCLRTAHLVLLRTHKFLFLLGRRGKAKNKTKTGRAARTCGLVSSSPATRTHIASLSESTRTVGFDEPCGSFMVNGPLADCRGGVCVAASWSFSQSVIAIV